MTENVDATSRIAERGRDELVKRLRPAFEEAAAAHADVLELTPEQLDKMIERAADQADGLQWRRALAAVAVDELGISMAEALSHPAVARAQEMLEVPSYEDTLASVIGEAALRSQRAEPEELEGPEEVEEPVDAGGDEAAAEEVPLEVSEEEAEIAEEPVEVSGEDDQLVESAGEPEVEEEPAAEKVEDAEEPAAAMEEHEPLATEDAEEPAEEEPELEEELAEEPEGLEAESDDEEEEEEEEGGPLRLSAVHVGGIADLEPAETGIELCFSEEGLDILRADDAILGRLTWQELRALEVASGGRWRRRRHHEARLIIRAEQGDATFEIPDLSPEELEEQIRPVAARL